MALARFMLSPLRTWVQIGRRLFDLQARLHQDNDVGIPGGENVIHIQLGAVQFGPSLHYVRSVRSAMHGFWIHLAFADDGSGEPIGRIAVWVVDELAETIVGTIKQNLRFTPWPPWRTGIAKGDSTGGGPAVLGAQPQAEILAPGDREIAQSAVLNNRLGF